MGRGYSRLMTIAAYIRVSSRAQDHATQRDAIERAAATRGDKVGMWYAEKRSAKTMQRAELQRLLADATAGKLTKLYLFRLDRLTRTGIVDTLRTLEDLKAAGVEVVSIADGFDLQGPCAEIIVAVMSWAAKMENLARAERVSAARERIESEGGAWGRPKAMPAAYVAKALEMKAAGKTVREISAALGIKKSTIGRAVKAA
jgi:DNA invertase Pin-like site-specific DNA recombinase